MGIVVSRERMVTTGGRDGLPNDPSLLLMISGAPQREVYFMGLIDVLTQYDTKKKAAHAAKTVKHGVSGSTSHGWAFAVV